MSTHRDDREAEAEGAISRAFEIRHPGLALAWRLIRHRPIAGALIAVGFLITSTIIIEGYQAANTFFQKWADVNWYAPYGARVNATAINRVNRQFMDSRLHIGDVQRLKRDLPFYLPLHSVSLPSFLPLLDGLKAEDPEIVSRSSSVLKSGESVSPVFVVDGSLAQTEGFALVWHDFDWGLVPIDAYRKAELPMEDKSP